VFALMHLKSSAREKSRCCGRGQLLLLLAYFFEGKSEKSAREGILIWCADQLQAVKWRNFKVHFYKQDTMVSPAQKLSIPLLFNLYTNPQEDEDKTPTDTWVNRPGAEDGGRVRSEHKDAPADRHGYA
jgi:arylsulfatase